MIPVRFPDSSYNFWRWWLACDRKFYLRARIKWSEMVIILNCTLPNRCGVRIFYPIIIGLIKNTILKGTYKTNIIIYAHSSSLWCHLYSTILYLYGVYFLIDQTSQSVTEPGISNRGGTIYLNIYGIKYNFFFRQALDITYISVLRE
jgi:hypothetical protein